VEGPKSIQTSSTTTSSSSSHSSTTTTNTKTTSTYTTFVLIPPEGYSGNEAGLPQPPLPLHILPAGQMHTDTSTPSTIRICLTPEGDSTAVTTSAATLAPPVANDGGRYALYDQMRSMRLPEGAVRQKMALDGLPDEEIARYFGEVANADSWPGSPTQTEIPRPLTSSSGKLSRSSYS
jgi:hypothetical protein